MGTKAVVLHHTTPVGIDHLLAALLRSNAILPVVFICETPPRPAQYRYPDLLQRFHHISAHAVHIGNIRILPHVDTLVDTPAQMLRKMSL